MDKVDAALAAIGRACVPDLFDNPARNDRAKLVLRAGWDAALVSLSLIAAAQFGAFLWF
jgi:hypothetical protein